MHVDITCANMWYTVTAEGEQGPSSRNCRNVQTVVRKSDKLSNKQVTAAKYLKHEASASCQCWLPCLELVQTIFNIYIPVDIFGSSVHWIGSSLKWSVNKPAHARTVGAARARRCLLTSSCGKHNTAPPEQQLRSPQRTPTWKPRRHARLDVEPKAVERSSALLSAAAPLESS